jgi:CRISPR/Cas system-associated exonuclease Cas4 (RecB family)
MVVCGWGSPVKKLENEFSWSKSRDGKFRECLRAYWFHYYGAWGGWSAGAPARSQALYHLKNVRSRQMWAGEVVHRCIEHALVNLRRGIEPMAADAAIEATIHGMRDEWRRSRSGAVKERLIEHEYSLPVPDAEWQDNADHVRQCLWNFYASRQWETLRKLPAERWLDVETLSSFLFEGVKVFVKLDVAYREEQGHVVIVDWKTGRAPDPDHSMQVATYALFAAETWGGAPTDVRTRLVHLATGSSEEVRLGARALDSALSRIRASIRDMKLLLVEPHGNEAHEADFPPVAEPRICRRCSFRRVCLEERIIPPLDGSETGSRASGSL